MVAGQRARGAPDRISTHPPFREITGSSELPSQSCLGVRCPVTMTTAASVDLVLAMHSTEVFALLFSMISVIPSEVTARVWLYHKGPPYTLNATQLRKRLESALLMRPMPDIHIRSIPNLGRNDGTYLMHLSEQYDNLAELIVFFKDTVAIQHWLGVHLKLRTMLSQPPAQLRVWCPFKERRVQFHFFINSYISQACAPRQGFLDKRIANGFAARRCYESDSTPTSANGFITAQPRPLGAWQETVGVVGSDGTYPKLYCSGGNFATSSAAVRRVSRSTFHRLFQNVSVGANVEAGHYMERSWLGLFGAEHMEAAPSTKMLVYSVDRSPLQLLTPLPSKVAFPPSPCRCVRDASMGGVSTQWEACGPNFMENMSSVLKAVADGRLVCAFLSARNETLNQARAKGWTAVRLPFDQGETAADAFLSPQRYVASALGPTPWTPQFVGFAGWHDEPQVHDILPGLLKAVDSRLNNVSISFACLPPEGSPEAPAMSTVTPTPSMLLSCYLPPQPRFSWVHVRRVTTFTRDFEQRWWQRYRRLRNSCGSVDPLTTLAASLVWTASVKLKNYSLVEFEHPAFRVHHNAPGAAGTASKAPPHRPTG
jgi:hypothetical protein